MNLFFSEAKKFVRARLDELSLQDPLLQGEVIDDANLDQLISELIEEAVTYVHEMAPASLMEGPLLTQDDLKDHWSVLNGVLDVDLSGISQDALRVISFKAGDSDVKLTRMVYEDSPVGMMQHNRYVQGQPDNPVLVMLDDSPNYHPHLKYYTTDLTAEKMAFALRYFPLPKRQTYSISLSQTVVSFPGAGGSKSLSVFTERAWKVEGVPSWLILSDLSGMGDKKITFTTNENNTGGELNATLVFITDEGQTSVEVIQNRKAASSGIPGYQPGSKFLSVECTSALEGVVSAPVIAGNVYSFRVYASEGLAWTSVLDDAAASGMTAYNDWLSVSPATGIGKGADDYTTVNVHIREANDTNEPRQAELKFTADGVKSVKFYIRQDNILSVIPSNQPIPADGGSTTATVISKLPWTAEPFIENYEGNFRIQPAAGAAGTTTVTLSAGENQRAERSFGFTVKAGPAAVDAEVTQLGSDGPVDKPHSRIQFSPSLLQFTAEGDCDEGLDENGYVNVAFNIPPSEYSLDFTATPSWLHIMADDHGFRVKVDPNTGTEKRAYAIEVWLTDEPDVKDYLIVEQDAPAGEEEEPADKWVLSFIDGSTPGGIDILQASANATYVNCQAHVVCNGKKVSGVTVVYQTGASWATKYNTSNQSWESNQDAVWLSIKGTSTNVRRTTLTAYVKDHPEATETLVIEQEGTATSSKRFTMAPATKTYPAAADLAKFSVSSNESWALNITGDAKFGDNGQKALQGSGSYSEIYVELTPNTSTTATKTVTISGRSASGITGTVTFTLEKKEEVKETPVITLDSNAASIGPEGGLLTVTLDSNVPWRILYGGSGLTFAQNEGPAGDGQEIDITVGEYTGTTEDRVMTVHFRSLDNKYGETFTITQAKAVKEEEKSIRFITSGASFKYTSETKTAGVQATGAYKLVSKPSWLTVKAGGTTLAVNGTSTATSLSLTSSLNKGEKRQGTVVLALVADSTKTATFNVNQAQSPETILSISPTGTTKDTGTITLTSDRAWKITGMDAGLTISPASGTGDAVLSYTAEKNPWPTERILQATVITEDGAQASTFKVTQPAGVFRVSPESLQFAAAGESKTVKVYSSAPWKVTSKPDWIAVSATEGGVSEAGASLSLTAGASGGSIREGNVTIENMITKTVKTVKVSQIVVADDTYITISPSGSVTLPEGDDSMYVTVTSNRDWTAEYTGGYADVLSGRAGIPTRIQLIPDIPFYASLNRSHLTVTAGSVTADLEVIKTRNVEDETIDTPEYDKDDEFDPGAGGGNGGAGGGGTDPDVPEDGGPTEPGLDNENGEIEDEKGDKNV